MAFNVNTGMERVGAEAGDDTASALVAAAIETAWSLAETFCDRGLQLKVSTATFRDLGVTDTVQLPRYPVHDVIGVKALDGGNFPDYRLNYEHGIIQFKGYMSTEFQIKYMAGLNPVPAAVELALWQIFDNVYKSLIPQSDYSTEMGIDKIVIQGVGSLTYTDTTPNASTGVDNNYGGMLTDAAAAILTPFKRYYC